MLFIITRRRQTLNSLEESIIDYVLVSEVIEEQIDSVEIDEEKNCENKGCNKI